MNAILYVEATVNTVTALQSCVSVYVDRTPAKYVPVSILTLSGKEI